jgi:IS30 family transposase
MLKEANKMNDNEIVEKKPWKQLTLLQRVKSETLLKAGVKPSDIAKEIECSVRTVQREIKRGTVTVWKAVYDPVAIEAKAKRKLKCRLEYSADAADLANKKAESKIGRHLKIGEKYEFDSFLEKKIVKERLSPYVALEEARKEEKSFAGLICVKTLYNYIDNDVFLNITNKDLCVKRNKKKRHYGVVKRLASNNRKGRSIEDRDNVILKRTTFDH